VIDNHDFIVMNDYQATVIKARLAVVCVVLFAVAVPAVKVISYCYCYY
jgi:hypothetical protein